MVRIFEKNRNENEKYTHKQTCKQARKELTTHS